MPLLFDSVTCAWALWVLITQGFSGTISSWTYDRKNKKVKTFHTKKQEFIPALSKRLDQVTIEQHDALHIILIRDTPETFFYIDPPYMDADQGHYSGYTEPDFINLLELLSTVKGKFLLSCYPSALLDSYVKKCNWHIKLIEKVITASIIKEHGKRERKIEVLVANYPIE
jgi:DNA adenine methylase